MSHRDGKDRCGSDNCSANNAATATGHLGVQFFGTSMVQRPESHQRRRRVMLVQRFEGPSWSSRAFRCWCLAASRLAVHFMWRVHHPSARCQVVQELCQQGEQEHDMGVTGTLNWHLWHQQSVAAPLSMPNSNFGLPRGGGKVIGSGGQPLSLTCCYEQVLTLWAYQVFLALSCLSASVPQSGLRGSIDRMRPGEVRRNR